MLGLGGRGVVLPCDHHGDPCCELGLPVLSWQGNVPASGSSFHTREGFQTSLSVWEFMLALELYINK